MLSPALLPRCPAFAMPDFSSQLGDALAPDCTLERELGRGGMGAVFRFANRGVERERARMAKRKAKPEEELRTLDGRTGK